jgi:hypothetical protein
MKIPLCPPLQKKRKGDLFLSAEPCPYTLVDKCQDIVDRKMCHDIVDNGTT